MMPMERLIVTVTLSASEQPMPRSAEDCMGRGQNTVDPTESSQNHEINSFNVAVRQVVSTVKRKWQSYLENLLLLLSLLTLSSVL
jgi:hypothetical protein